MKLTLWWVSFMCLCRLTLQWAGSVCLCELTLMSRFVVKTWKFYGWLYYSKAERLAGPITRGSHLRRYFYFELMPPRDCLASLKLPTVCGVLPRSSHSPLTACFARLFSAPSFAELAKNASSRYQLYISRSNDPFLNLSVEHYLLQKSHIDSTILFLYIDRPCVVIGRNQNPWLEVDLRLLNGCSTGLRRRTPDEKAHRQVLDQVDLVRRRSGGGTVFHDHGNINYSVICPTPDFTRDKHAEMVVQAIRRVNPRARVNERHDIVLDQGEMLPESLRPDPRDLHKTAYTGGASTNPALKVSGSAYKLTRNRSLHHGTCLIQSPNLDVIPKYLRSPARAFMKARGVDSVRSPISNIAGDNKYMGQSKVFGFLRNILEAFTALYGLDQEILASFTQEGDDSVVVQGRNWVCAYVQDEAAEVPEIRAGMEELKVFLFIHKLGSLLLIWSQT